MKRAARAIPCACLLLGCRSPEVAVAVARVGPPDAGAIVVDGKGPCAPRSCDLRSQACCDNLRTGDHRCLPKAGARQDMHCGLGEEWAFAMSCGQSTDCAGGATCCNYPLVPIMPGMLEDPGPYVGPVAGTRMEQVCDDSCPTHEVCATNGRCKGYWGCENAPDSRPGGICTKSPVVKKAPFVAARTNDAGVAECADKDYSLSSDNKGCDLVCVSPEDCGGSACSNDVMGGYPHCQR